MELSLENFAEVSLITVHAKRIDASGAIRFKDQMRELTAQGGLRVVLDLTSVDFVDSSGLGAIVASMKQLRAGQVLELATLSPVVDKVFRLTRMDSVFKIHDDISGVVGAMRNAS